MASPRSSNGSGEARRRLVALPDLGSRVLSASAVVAYVAVGAASMLGRSVMEAARGTPAASRLISTARVARLECGR